MFFRPSTTLRARLTRPLIPRPALTIRRNLRPYSASIPPPPPSNTASTTPLGTDTAEPRLSLTFTCTVPQCGTRSAHTFTRRAYERGVVLVQCPGCQNRHLIADHLRWFEDGTEGGRYKTVEEIVRARGGEVRRGRGVMGADGVVEWVE